MADFGWFSYMGKLLNLFRLLKKTSIVVFSAKLIFKTLKKIYYLRPRYEMAILGDFRIWVGYSFFSDS